jgi:hypothetical protein
MSGSDRRAKKRAEAEARRVEKQVERKRKALEEAREREARKQAKKQDSIARGSQAFKEVTMVLSETLARRLERVKEGRAVLEAFEQAESGVQYVVEPGRVPELATISWRRENLLSVVSSLVFVGHFASFIVSCNTSIFSSLSAGELSERRSAEPCSRPLLALAGS